MNKVPVFIGLDVEDPIHPESDDALKRLAEIFTEAGIPATLFMVGEKARLFRKRGRRDVLDALRPHEIGFHGNYWYQFPEIAMVYCERLPWDEAVAKALESELSGLHDVAEITGRFPSAWVPHEGNSGPALAYALRRAGVRVSNGGFGGGGEPLWVMDTLTISRARYTIPLPGSWKFPPRDPLNPHVKPPLDADAELKQFQKKLDERLEEGTSHLNLTQHPTCWVTGEWWGWYEWQELAQRSGPGRPGVYPALRKFLPAQKRSAADTEAHFELTRRAMKWIASRNDVEVTTFSRFAERYQDAAGAWVSLAELREAAHAISGQLDAVRTAGIWLSPADVLYLLTHAFSYLFDRGSFPERFQVKRVLGPVEEPWRLPGELTLTRDRMLVASRNTETLIERTGRVPAAISTNRYSEELGPAEFTKALAGMLCTAVETNSVPEQITVRPGPEVPVCAEMPFFKNYSVGTYAAPAGFRVERMRKQVRWQSWSYRPLQ